MDHTGSLRRSELMVAELLCEMAQRIDKKGFFSAPAPSIHSVHDSFLDVPVCRQDESSLKGSEVSSGDLEDNASDLARVFQCKVCLKVLASPIGLRQHRNIHKKIPPYACDSCPKRFNQRSTLITHRRLHTGVRPYRCLACLRSFSDYSTLVKHRRTHSGSQPYACAKCGRAFSQSGNMWRHLKSCKH